MSGRRRTLLTGLAVAGVSALPAGAAPPLGENDRPLLALDAARYAAAEAEETACKTADRAEHAGCEEEADAAAAAREAAWNRWCAALDAMAATPADGLLGVAVKAGVLCRALEIGAAEADQAVAESLTADLGRLVPGVMA